MVVSNTELEKSIGEMFQGSKRIISNMLTRQWQLTFDDLKWMCLATKEEKAKQKRRIRQLGEKMWGSMVYEDKEMWGLQKQVHKHQLAAK